MEINEGKCHASHGGYPAGCFMESPIKIGMIFGYLYFRKPPSTMITKLMIKMIKRVSRWLDEHWLDWEASPLANWINWEISVTDCVPRPRILDPLEPLAGDVKSLEWIWHLLNVFVRSYLSCFRAQTTWLCMFYHVVFGGRGVLYCYGLFMDMHSLYMYTSKYPHNSLQIPMRCNHFLRIICELCPNLFPQKIWVSYNVTPQLQVGFHTYSIYHKC